MAVNELSFNQISSLLKSITEQATGQAQIQATNTAEFVTQAQTTLKTGYDPLMTAISQVLGKTIISVRDYDEHFKGLRADAFRWGNHVRKINYLDMDTVDYKPLSLTNNGSIDQWQVRKQEVVQTNFYGFDAWDDFVTIYESQLDTAFQSPDDFQRFLSGQLLTINNRHKQHRESLARMALVNMIGGVLSAKNDSQVIHLLSEYKAETGQTESDSPLSDADSTYDNFIRWVYARINSVSNMMTERSALYHTNITGKSPFMRHTPVKNQKFYILNNQRYAIQSRVLSKTFNPDYLKMMDFETVNYWQSITDTDAINVTPNYMGTNGVVSKPASPVQQDKIFGVLFDEEACGYTVIEEKMRPTPANAAGDYYNLWWHNRYRYWNDSTENCCVFLMD